MRNDDYLTLKPIGHIYCDVKSKFGVPRQSGLAPNLCGRIVFLPEWRDANSLKGIEDFTHLWLIWGFSEGFRSRKDNTSAVQSWSPTVRPPILGGNERIGVFATRSPNRPNPLGLTVVKLQNIEYDSKDGPVLTVSGIDMMNGTPIYDIKPYIPYADIQADASGGFTQSNSFTKLEVKISDRVQNVINDKLSSVQYDALIEILTNDPRPQYQRNPNRIYGISYAGLDINFKVNDTVLIVTDVD